MTFCTACGHTVVEGTRFCSYCGRAVSSSSLNTPLAVHGSPEPSVVGSRTTSSAVAPPPRPTAAAAPPRVVVPVQDSVAPPAPPPPVAVAPPPGPLRSGWSKGSGEIDGVPLAHPAHPAHHFVKVATVVLILVVALIAAIYFLHPPDPSVSLERARLAYTQQDQEAFDKYVDVQSVLGNGIDQFTDDYAQRHNLSHPYAFKWGVAEGAKLYLPQISRSIDQFVVTGNLPALPQWATGNATINSAITEASQVLHRVIQSQLAYQGVLSEDISGKDATVDVSIKSPFGTTPFTVKLRMVRLHNHWRIVAFDDVPRILREMGIQI